MKSIIEWSREYPKETPGLYKHHITNAKKLLSFHIKQTFLTEMLYSDIFFQSLFLLPWTHYDNHKPKLMINGTKGGISFFLDSFKIDTWITHSWQRYPYQSKTATSAFFFFNLNLQSLAILPSLKSKINVPIITVCNKQRRIFTVIMIRKKRICSTCYLKITYSFTSGGFPCDRSASTSGMQINTKPNWKTNNEFDKLIPPIDLFSKLMYSAIENK